FGSTCDPFGANAYGEQIFALRPDGSGLRQLTSTRGLVRGASGIVETELPGPVAYSGAPLPEPGDTRSPSAPGATSPLVGEGDGQSVSARRPKGQCQSGRFPRRPSLPNTLPGDVVVFDALRHGIRRVHDDDGVLAGDGTQTARAQALRPVPSRRNAPQV